jgi:hypothetical protein
MEYGALLDAAAGRCIIHPDWYAVSKALAFLRFAQAAQSEYSNVFSGDGAQVALYSRGFQLRRLTHAASCEILQNILISLGKAASHSAIRLQVSL